MLFFYIGTISFLCRYYCPPPILFPNFHISGEFSSRPPLMFCVSSWCYFRNTRSKRHRGPAAAPCLCGRSPKRGVSSHLAHMRPIKRQRLAEAAQLLEAQKATLQSKGHCEWKLPTPLALERREDRRGPSGTPQGRKRRCPGNAVSRCSWCRDRAGVGLWLHLEIHRGGAPSEAEAILHW